MRKVSLNDLSRKQKEYDLRGALDYYLLLGYKYDNAYELVSINLELETIK